MCLSGTCDAEKNHQQPCVHRDDVVILDMEAGLEHLGRGTTEGMDEFIVVIEPGARSVQTYKNVKRLAKDLGVLRLRSWQTRYGTKRMRNLSGQDSGRRSSWNDPLQYRSYRC